MRLISYLYLEKLLIQGMMKDFNSDASPLIKGKKATLDEAIKLIKKKIQKKKYIFPM